MIKKIKKQNGITLAALIITIIVMLILAGVSIGIVVNGDFFGKAENANTMNNEAISKAEQDEEDALKQNTEEFRVDEDFEMDVIEAYEYVDTDEDGAKDSLQQINYSLSKYLTENPNKEIYFKANTTRTNLYYTANNGVTFARVKPIEIEVEKIDQNGEKYKVTTISNIVSADPEDDTILAKVENLKGNLNDLTIYAKVSESDGDESALYALKYIHTIDTDATKNISSQKDTKLLKDENSRKIVLDDNQYADDGVTIEDTILKEYTENEKNIYLSNKTAISYDYTTVNENGENEFVITASRKSSIQDNNKSLTLYLVREEDTQDNNQVKIKNIYMDDYSIAFYNPINEIEITSPKSLEYRIKQEDAKEIIPKYITSEEIEADVNTFNVQILKNVVNINNTKDGYKGEFKLTGNKIYSTIVELPEGEITDIITLKAIAKDLGGKIKETSIEIPVASNNFMVIAEKNGGNEVKTAYFNKLSEALNGSTNGVIETTTIGNEAVSTQEIFTGAKSYISQGYKTTIKQIIAQYPMDEELYTKEEKTHEINGTKEYKYYFDIGDSLSGLTYDLNGNNLNFKDEAKIRIGKGKTFTLKSSKDAYSNYKNHQNGTIIFNHNTTFTERSEGKKEMSLENFFKVEKYKNLKSLESFIKYELKKEANLLNMLLYGGKYISRLMNSYKEYMNSFNYPKFQNTDYKQTMEAIINNGTFNFESGKIQLTTNETVTAYGAFGGGIVITVADTFLDALRAIGLETPNLTDYFSSFAKLENTAVGVKNYGTVILGTGSGVTKDANPFPEISILIDSAANGIGISMGTITNPNRVVSRAYGVWNAESIASTTMNSGFMEMAITNNTNNWVSLNVGRTYGIFNDHGTTTLNGFTQKEIIREISIYGLITKRIFKQREIEGDSKIKDALTEALNNVDSFWENEIQSKTYEGFFAYSELQVLYKGALGGTTCYTNSYAIANAADRRVVKNENGSSYDDGINFGPNLILKEKEFEGTINGNFWTKQDINYSISIPEYYVLTYNGTDYDYHDNVYQKISNPLNHYFDFDTIVGTAFSTGTNLINNIVNTSWIGQDFVDDNMIYNIIKQTVRGIGNTIEEILGI